MITVPKPNAYPIELFSQNSQQICGHFQVSPRADQHDMLAHLSVTQSGGLDIASIGLEMHVESLSKQIYRRCKFRLFQYRPKLLIQHISVKRSRMGSPQLSIWIVNHVSRGS